MSDRLTEDELADLLRHTEDATTAYLQGDMDRYVQLTHHAPGFTLLAPYGGPASRHEHRAEELTAGPNPFGGGESRLEHVEAHAWGDTLVLAMIERQHGKFGDRPDQDLSLRVTHVYRRDGDDWLLVHRHADPLVRTLELDELTALQAGPEPPGGSG